MTPRLPLLLFIPTFTAPLAAQAPPVTPDPAVAAAVDRVSATRLETVLRTLVGFGTRHTLSDTLSPTRGIGAARRYVHAEFERISRECGGCLSVRYQQTLLPAGSSRRVDRDVNLVNVLAELRGTVHPDRRILMTAHLDSRASDVMDRAGEAPGANDDGSGVAAVLEAARVLTGHRWGKTLVFGVLVGEEQGLLGAGALAAMARDSGWTIEGVLNNDIVGGRAGMNGAANDSAFRIFSEPVPQTGTDQDRVSRRFDGGEVDGPSRQLARYAARVARRHVPGLDPVLIYRLDRFGRGGDHRAFNDLGFTAVRFTEMNEDYRRQHQNIRLEDGIQYGDLLEGISYPYLAGITRANVAVLAELAQAPPPPDSVRIRGAVSPSTTLRWHRVPSPRLAGYRVYWRETTASQWQWSRWVGDVSEATLENVVIDNYLFGVAAVSGEGDESVVVTPYR
ncbi:MAG: M28 family metallopeptidase [Gemmatimonadales bacterium]